MASLNKVQLIANLGRDPEIKYLASGDAIANLAVATSYKSKDKNTGEAKEHTEWHRLTAFGRTAEIIGQYLKKGSSVYVEGRLQTRKYQKDGQDHYATDIIIEDIKFLDKRPAGEQQPALAQQQRPAPQAQRPAGATQGNRPPAGDDIPWDDIPF